MSEYFKHWLSFGEEGKEKGLPKMFMVNWFKKDKGRIMWPGFSENVRVIKWIFERCDSKGKDEANAVETPIGYIPNLKSGHFDLSNLDLSREDVDKIFSVDAREFLKDLSMYKEFYKSFEDSKAVPKALQKELGDMAQRLNEQVSKMKAL